MTGHNSRPNRIFSEVRLWCGGRDSNPCSPKARDLESCASGPSGLAWLCHPRPITPLFSLADNCFRDGWKTRTSGYYTIERDRDIEAHNYRVPPIT